MMGSFGGRVALLVLLAAAATVPFETAEALDTTTAIKHVRGEMQRMAKKLGNKQYLAKRMQRMRNDTVWLANNAAESVLRLAGPYKENVRTSALLFAIRVERMYNATKPYINKAIDAVSPHVENALAQCSALAGKAWAAVSPHVQAAGEYYEKAMPHVERAVAQAQEHVQAVAAKVQPHMQHVAAKVQPHFEVLAEKARPHVAVAHAKAKELHMAAHDALHKHVSGIEALKVYAKDLHTVLYAAYSAVVAGVLAPLFLRRVR